MKTIQRRWFGTDGIRGVYGKEPMTPEFIWRCGRAAAEFFKGEIIIGRDTRASGPMLEETLTQGIKFAKGKIFHAGVLPTAAIAAFTIQRQAAAGIMISASHNPYKDNGIKFFGPDGFKLDDNIELQLEEKIELIPDPFLSISQPSLSFNHDEEAFAVYREMLLQSLPQNFSLNNFRIILDLANGAAFQSAPQILLSLGARISILSDQPDGKNINENCGCLHTDVLQKRVKESHGAIGVAHDGDADRLILIDENGEKLDGDEIMAIIAADYLQEKRLAKNTLVATIMSNLGLEEAVAPYEGLVIRTDVGDRYVLEAMRQEKLNLGGEQSGHMIFLDHFTTGDGLLSALQVLKVMTKTGKPLNELRKVISLYPQSLTSHNVIEKEPLDSLPAVTRALKECKNKLGGNGRVLLRYSGTENKIRLLIEARDASLIPSLQDTILEALRIEYLLDE